MTQPTAEELDVLKSWGVQVDDPNNISADLLLSAKRDISLKKSIDSMLDSKLQVKLAGVEDKITKLEQRVLSIEQVSPQDFPFDRLEDLENKFSSVNIGLMGVNSYIGKLHAVISAQGDKIGRLTTAYTSANAQLVAENLRSRRLNCRIYGVSFPDGPFELPSGQKLYPAKSKIDGAKYLWRCGVYKVFGKNADDSNLPYLQIAHPLPDLTPQPGRFKRSSKRAILQFTDRNSAFLFWQNQSLFISEAKSLGLTEISIGSDWNGPSSAFMHKFSSDPRVAKVQIIDGNLLCRLSSNPAKALKVKNPYCDDLLNAFNDINIPDLSNKIPDMPNLHDEVAAAQQHQHRSNSGQLSSMQGIQQSSPHSYQPWDVQVEQCTNRFGLLSSPASSPFPTTHSATSNSLGLGLSNSSNTFGNSIVTLNSITQPTRLSVLQPPPPLSSASSLPLLTAITTASTSTPSTTLPTTVNSTQLPQLPAATQLPAAVLPQSSAITLPSPAATTATALQPNPLPQRQPRAATTVLTSLTSTVTPATSQLTTAMTQLQLPSATNTIPTLNTSSSTLTAYQPTSSSTASASTALGSLSLSNDPTILRPPTLVVASPEGDNPLTDDGDTGIETGTKKKARRGRPNKQTTANKENSLTQIT